MNHPLAMLPTDIRNALLDFLGNEEIPGWLQQPNPAFDGFTPLQLFERGESDRLWRMIYELESGQPG